MSVSYIAPALSRRQQWAPVRTYHAVLSENGVKALWRRLMLKLLTRHGIDEEDTFKPQPFSVIITIAGPEGKAPVYDELSRLVLNRYQSQNIAVRVAAHTQVRGRS